MPSFTIKVPNNDEGEDLGEFQSDYLPRVGESFVLWHPHVCAKKDEPFCGIVSMVIHEAIREGHPYATDHNFNTVGTVVWLAEEHGAPTLYCVCTEEERVKWNTVDREGRCDNCGHTRRT